MTGTVIVPGGELVVGSESETKAPPGVGYGVVGYPDTLPLTTEMLIGKAAHGPGGLIVVPVVPPPRLMTYEATVAASNELILQFPVTSAAPF